MLLVGGAIPGGPHLAQQRRLPAAARSPLQRCSGSTIAEENLPATLPPVLSSRPAFPSLWLCAVMRDAACALGITSCFWCGSGKAYRRPWTVFAAGVLVGAVGCCAVTSRGLYAVGGGLVGALAGFAISESVRQQADAGGGNR